MQHWIKLVIFLLAAVLAGCAPEREYTDTLAMTAEDCGSRIHRWSVRSGDQPTLEFENPTGDTYIWVLLGNVIQEPYDSSDLDGAYTTVEIPAGKKFSAPVAVPLAPGEYQVLCGPSGALDGKVVSLLTVTLLEDNP